MLISIIISSLNEAKYIETTLQSIRYQSYIDNYELILVDSGSTDNTVQLASKYVDSIIRSPKGKLTARNLATKYANGDIIVSVDADCYYPPQWLANLLQPFNANENQDSNILNVVATSSYARGSLWATYTDWFSLKILYRNRLPGRNSAYYKNVFDTIGGFDESVDQTDILAMINEEEVQFGKRLAKYGDIVFVPEAYCEHLGEDKFLCRLGRLSPEYCREQGRGKGLKTF